MQRACSSPHALPTASGAVCAAAGEPRARRVVPGETAAESASSRRRDAAPDDYGYGHGRLSAGSNAPAHSAPNLRRPSQSLAEAGTAAGARAVRQAAGLDGGRASASTAAASLPTASARQRSIRPSGTPPPNAQQSGGQAAEDAIALDDDEVEEAPPPPQPQPQPQPQREARRASSSAQRVLDSDDDYEQPDAGRTGRDVAAAPAGRSARGATQSHSPFPTSFELATKRVRLGTYNCGAATVSFKDKKIEWIPNQGCGLPGSHEYPLISVPTSTVTAFEVDKVRHAVT